MGFHFFSQLKVLCQEIFFHETGCFLYAQKQIKSHPINIGWLQLIKHRLGMKLHYIII